MTSPSFAAEGIVVATFGRELERLRTHPEVAWERAWDSAGFKMSIEAHDRLKQTAFAAYGIAHELRIKTTLAAMGAPPVEPELRAHWCDDSPCTVH